MSLKPDQPDRSENRRRQTSSSDELRPLEQATAPVNQPAIVGNADNPSADAEMVAMRESWLALSHLLETTTPSVDEALLVSQVHRRVGRQIKLRRWKVTGLALAASLFLAVSIGWLVARSSHERVPDNSNPIIVQAPTIQVQVEEPPFAPSEPATQDPTAIAWDDAYWQDDLADDLAETQQVLATVQANWSRFPDPMAWMQFQMNEFEQELGDNSL